MHHSVRHEQRDTSLHKIRVGALPSPHGAAMVAQTRDGQRSMSLSLVQVAADAPAKRVATMPQTETMMPSHRGPPTRTRIMLLGTWNAAYVMKNSDDPCG